MEYSQSATFNLLPIGNGVGRGVGVADGLGVRVIVGEGTVVITGLILVGVSVPPQANERRINKAGAIVGKV